LAIFVLWYFCILIPFQCFDIVGWATGRKGISSKCPD